MQTLRWVEAACPQEVWPREACHQGACHPTAACHLKPLQVRPERALEETQMLGL